ncbi:MAG: sensor histidine kinase [Burkholderiales bacterium]
MKHPSRSTWVWWLAGLTLLLVGALWIARQALVEQREAFDTDARIAHRLLSQRVAQIDAVLATLALLQTQAEGANAAPEQRLPALYPQVLRVLKRERDTLWLEPDMQAAESRSRSAGRAELAMVDLAKGRYTVVHAAHAASYALELDLERLVPWSEWPMQRSGPVRVLLRHQGQIWVAQAGQQMPYAVGSFSTTKKLASSSQPLELMVERAVDWRELPWTALLLWAVMAIGAVWALALWHRQRATHRRRDEVLRLGEVGRLNALGEWAAGLAHELNQPLTALLANTQAAQRLLSDDAPDLTTARGAMAQAVQQAQRASDVLGRLRRSVQRPDTAVASQAVSLPDAVRRVLYLLEPECQRLGVQAQCEFPATPPQAQADPVALEQIIHNLLSNALQALETMPVGQRHLTVELKAAEVDGGPVRLLVRDSGPGISAQALPRVFEPFFTTREGGLGLGLSLCETLATGMGGGLSCRSLSPHGAEFTLSLPAAGRP